tara:strand:- start:822 stop:1238 length:417 start_codon:yes stop_codon:yes gene_type:complete
MTTTSEMTVLAETPMAIDGSWVDGEAYIQSKDVKEVLGWELKPEGLCKGDVCIPLGDTVDSNSNDSFNLSHLAALVGRPSLTTSDTGTVTIGQPYSVRSEALTKRVAPDFSLPDISGVDRALSDWAGKKRLLVAFSSW